MGGQSDDLDYEIEAEDFAEVKCYECDIAFRTLEELDEHNKTEHNMASHAGKKIGRKARANSRENRAMEEDQISM